MDATTRRRLVRDVIILAAAFALLLATGTALFVGVAGDGVEVAFYRAIGAITTNDFVGRAPAAGGERAVAAGLTVAGGLFYLALVGSVIRTLLVQGVADNLRDRMRRKRMSHIHSHYVVCGYGNIGRAVVDALHTDRKCVVVIDRKRENVGAAVAAGATAAFLGEAYDPVVLREAGIERAAALVAAVGSDAENIYIGLAAKRCNPTIYIAARASTKDAETNMRDANVFDFVTTPYAGAGRSLANDVLARKGDPAGIDVGRLTKALAERS